MTKTQSLVTFFIEDIFMVDSSISRFVYKSDLSTHDVAQPP